MKEKLDALIASVHHLPPSPRVLVKLLELFKQPEPDIQEIVKLLTHDPSFTTEVLKCCNSAYAGAGRPAEDMFEAVTRLGYQEIYRIVMAMFARDAIVRPVPGDTRHVEILWNHSIAVAVVSGALAGGAGELPASAFTAGLLHDVGKVIMISAQKGRYTQAVLDAGLFGRPVVAMEKQLFGFDHADVGSRLLGQWGLPPNIIAAVQYHHNSAGAGEYERLAAVVQLANLVAHGTGEKLSGHLPDLRQAAGLLGQTGSTPESLNAALPAMQENLEQVKAMLRG